MYPFLLFNNAQLDRKLVQAVCRFQPSSPMLVTSSIQRLRGRQPGSTVHTTTDILPVPWSPTSPPVPSRRCKPLRLSPSFLNNLWLIDALYSQLLPHASADFLLCCFSPCPQCGSPLRARTYQSQKSLRQIKDSHLLGSEAY